MLKKPLITFIVSLNFSMVLGQLEVTSEITDDHSPIEGTKISMVAPEDFTKAVNFSGFQQDESGASIMVLDLPGPFSEVSKGFTEEGLQSQGMTLNTIEELRFNGLPAFLLTVGQNAYGNTYKKHILTFGTEKESIIINGTFLAEMENLSKPIKKSLLTTVYNADLEIDPFSTVDFEVVTEGTKLLFAKSMSGSLIFSVDGKIPSETEDQSNFIISRAFSEQIIINKKKFTQNRIEQLPIEIESIISTEPIEIDGLKGFEIIADAKDKTNGDRKIVYQAMIFKDKLYYIFVGSSEADFENNIAIFRKITETFRRK